MTTAYSAVIAEDKETMAAIAVSHERFACWCCDQPRKACHGGAGRDAATSKPSRGTENS